MTINNLNYNVPQQVRNLFYSNIPFGSEYVIYTSSYSQSSQTYVCIYKKIGSQDLEQLQIVHSNNDYLLSKVTNNNSYDGFEVSSPYYCYSSLPMQGIKEVLPHTYDLICLMCIVVCCLTVLRTVFGGIKLWSINRKKYLV